MYPTYEQHSRCKQQVNGADLNLEQFGQVLTVGSLQRIATALERIHTTLEEINHYLSLAGRGEGVASAQPETPDAGSLLPLPLTELGLPEWIVYRLKNESILNVGDLVKRSSKGLLRVRRFGPKVVQTIREALGKFGLSLRD